MYLAGCENLFCNLDSRKTLDFLDNCLSRSHLNICLSPCYECVRAICRIYDPIHVRPMQTHRFRNLGHSQIGTGSEKLEDVLPLFPARRCVRTTALCLGWFRLGEIKRAWWTTGIPPLMQVRIAS